MKKIFIFMIALLLSQQYLSAQNITTTYSLPGSSTDAQTQKIMVRPSNPDEQIILSRDGNNSYFYLIPPDRGMAQRVGINSSFIVNDFDLFGDTIIFCGKRTNNGVDRAFIGVATFQSLFNSNPSWIPIIDNHVTFLERVLLYRDGTALCAACYAHGNPVFYRYTGSFSSITRWIYDLGTTSENIMITDFVVTNTSIVYVGMVNHLITSVNLYKIDKDFSTTPPPTITKFASFSDRGNGGVITQLNKDTIITALSKWDNVMETNIYIIDINNPTNVSKQTIQGYEEKSFPIDIVYNSDEKEILYLQHSALHLFATERRDALYRLEAFPTGSYQADVVYKFQIPTAVFRYNSIDLITKEELIVCGRDFNSGDVTFFEQMIDRMPHVNNCIDYITESIQNSITNPTLQSQTLTVQLTSTCNASPTQTETRSIIGITTDCQE